MYMQAIKPHRLQTFIWRGCPVVRQNGSRSISGSSFIIAVPFPCNVFCICCTSFPLLGEYFTNLSASLELVEVSCNVYRFRFITLGYSETVSAVRSFLRNCKLRLSRIQLNAGNFPITLELNLLFYLNYSSFWLLRTLAIKCN